MCVTPRPRLQVAATISELVSWNGFCGQFTTSFLKPFLCPVHNQFLETFSVTVSQPVETSFLCTTAPDKVAVPFLVCDTNDDSSTKPVSK